MTASSMSKGFFEFVKSIGEAKSKQEEDGIIENELHILKAKMGARNVGARQMREYLIRMVYVEMLGHDASFGHIHAVKLTRANKLVDKRVGYMACSLCLHKDHELMLLLVGGLQTDLQSQNQLEVSTALIVSCKLINRDTIPAILPLVNKLLNHSEATIRKKAIMVIQRFNELDVYRDSSNVVEEVSDKAKRMLCDKDPSVMGASLHLLLDLVSNNSENASNDKFDDLVSSFVSILKQIIEHRLPKDYDYHRMPAPWTQIKLLQILAILGTANRAASEGMYEVLHEVMRRADIGINVGYAIIYECVRTVTTIYPNTQLLAEAAKCTSRFITSENHNLKYLGINALASIVQINPSAANEHQMIVIDCLQDKDETLRRKTLDLLYKMTNENNVNVICNKLIISLRDSMDVYLRTQLIEKITFLAEKFAPDTIWFIDTMSQVFELGADLVKTQIAHNFVKILAEGIVENQEDEESEEDIGNYAADFFYEILSQNLKKKRKKIPNVLMRIVCYVLGEYGQFCTGKSVDVNEEDDEDEDDDELTALSPMQIISTLWSVIEKQGQDLSTRQWAMSATQKLVRHLHQIPLDIQYIVAKYKTSTHSDLVQLSHELTELCQERELMNYVFTESSIVDEIKVDSELKFLDNFVSLQIKQGKRSYSPPDDYDDSDDDVHGKHQQQSSLIFETRTRIEDLQSTLQVKQVDNAVANDAYSGGGGGGDNYGNDVEAEQEEAADYGIRVNRAGGGGPKPVWGDHVGRDEEVEDDDIDGGDEIMSRQQSKYDEQVITVIDPLANRGNASKPDISVPVKASKRKPQRPEDNFLIALSRSAGKSKVPTRKVRKKKGFKSAKSAKTYKPAIKKKVKVAKESDMFMAEEKEEMTQTPIKKQVAPQDDLLNFMNDAPPVQPKKAAPPQEDLLDDLLFGGPAQMPGSQGGGGDLLGDLFGGPSIPQPSNNSMGGSADIFGSLSPNPSSPNIANSGNSLMGINRGFAALKQQLGAKVMGFPRSHETDQILFDNGALQVSYFKIYKQQKSTLCVFISNVSAQNVSGIQISVKKDASKCQLQFGFDVANSSPSPKLKNATTAIIAQIDGGKTACQMITFGLTNPSQIVIPCNIILSIGNDILPPINLQISDLMRPSIITTKDFGINWNKLSLGSFQINLNLLNASISVYVEKLTKKLHCHHIETIKNEVIAAGNLASITNSNMLLPILIHCKCLQNQSYSIIVRTPNANISKVIGIELQQSLS